MLLQSLPALIQGQPDPPSLYQTSQPETPTVCYLEEKADRETTSTLQMRKTEALRDLLTNSQGPGIGCLAHFHSTSAMMLHSHVTATQCFQSVSTATHHAAVDSPLLFTV